MARRRLSSKKRGRCPACLAPLANGSTVCSSECSDIMWAITPTLDGELFERNLLDQGFDDLSNALLQAFEDYGSRS
jgi:hypothetical protein